jgi:alpha-N-acetylglucosaminidase
MLLAAVVLILALGLPALAASPEDAARGLVERLLPGRSGLFAFEQIPPAASGCPGGSDVFELESRQGKVVVRGNSALSMAVGLNWYLKYCGHCHVSLWGSNLALPEPPPPVPEKVRRTSLYEHRYYLNFCAFSYSLAWYDWPQWQRLIDWMALEGIDMPLSVTGQEAIWRAVYRELGLSDRQLDAFFVGPAYLPFGWMGCIDGWGGPLPQSWIAQHLALEKQIVARERQLGMTPVLQGFTGHVPAALAQVAPQAKLERLSSWAGFPPTHFLNPQDPWFARIGKRFIEEQTRQFGSDHLYAADTFIEMQPPSDDPRFLAAMGKGVYEAMHAGDPQAVWVLQSWMFQFQRNFWKEPQRRALLGAVPDPRMIVLDLYCERNPLWSGTEAFYGKPWMWNVIQDFGDVTSLHGNLPQLAGDLRAAAASPQRGHLAGIGMVNEGLGNNPVVIDLLSEMAWRPEAVDVGEWLRGYVHARYGRRLPAAEAAWADLLATAYRVPGNSGSPICMRPGAEGDSGCSAHTAPPYDNAQLAGAWQKLLECSAALAEVDTFRFDLVNVARQVLANHAFMLRRQIAEAWRKKDLVALRAAGQRYLQLIRDVDELLATRREFLLGKWLADADRWATTSPQKRLYAWNARTLLTLWGPRDSTLHDYAARQWSGMLTGFYLPRWEMFLRRLDAALAAGRVLDAGTLEKDLRDWEAEWAHGRESYPAVAHGDTLAVARKLWADYGPALRGP